MSNKYDFIVIGSGAGGGVGAHFAASKGKKVAIFEAGTIGGECPNIACVPTKALLHTGAVYQQAKNASLFGITIPNAHLNYAGVRKWKDLVVSRTGASHGKESFQKEGIHVFHAKAHFISPHEIEANGVIYKADKFLIATGSKEFIPHVEGLDETGYITFRQAIELKRIPDSIVIFGGGAIACEFAQIFSSFGSKVTIVIRSDRILNKEDQEVSDLVEALFQYNGIQVIKNATPVRVRRKGLKKEVELLEGKNEHTITATEVMMATGKVPVLDFAPEKAGVELSHHKLVVNRYLQTTASHIYAAGDVVGPYLFTHVGYYQSYIAAHNAYSRKKLTPNYRVVPRCVFLTPEVASVGITENQAKEKGIRIKKGIVPIAIVGRANTSNDMDGFVKVIADRKGVIIGAAIVAPHAGEMIHELALAIKLRASTYDIGEMMHAYPTFSEAIKIACSIVE